MNSEIEIIAPHLKNLQQRQRDCAVVDLTVLAPNELAWLLECTIIALPLFHRIVLALKQNGVEHVVVLYRTDQEVVRSRFADDPLSRSVVVWHPATFDSDDEPWSGAPGLYLVHPLYLVNGVLLNAFDRARGEGDPSKVCQSDLAGEALLWVPGKILRQVRSPATTDAFQYIRSLPRDSVVIDDAEAAGQLVRNEQDITAVEKLLFADVTRKKGGYIAKRLNEPISLWIAKRLAPTPVTPNAVSLVNTILGLLSAALVAYGASHMLYWPLAAGALLFYAVDIFDGIDGELARLTFQSSKRGAMYDTISDNVTVLSFIAATVYAAYTRANDLSLLYAGGLALFLFLCVVLYAAAFTAHYYGRAHLRLYETRFMGRIPPDRPMTRLILSLRHLYTKDIYTALMALIVLVNRPEWVVYLALGFVLAACWGYYYLSSRYGALAVNS